MTRPTNGGAESRPSLYAQEESSADPGETTSILDGLASERSRDKVRRWKIFGASSVLLAVIALMSIHFAGKSPTLYRPLPLSKSDGAAGGGQSTKANLPTPIPSPPHPVVASLAAADVSSATAVVAGTSPAAVEPKEQPITTADKAAVENVPPVSTRAKANVKQTRNATKPNAADAASSRAIARSQKKRAATQTGEASRERKLAKKSGARPGTVPGSTAVAANVKTRGKQDKDIDLIAALLTHLSRPGSTTSTDPGHKAGMPTTESGNAADFLEGKRERPDRNRDVVVRASGESTETLVKRCRSLGGIEGELCRVRICAGNWGTDSACPSSSQSAN